MPALAIFCALLTLVVAAAVISRTVYSRSLIASAVAIFLRICNPRVGEKALLRRMEKYRRRNSRGYILPRMLCRGVEVEELNTCGMQVYRFLNSRRCSNTVQVPILYLHGGGYVRMPRRSHIRFLMRLARMSGRRIYLPIYPKAPNCTYEESFDAVLSLYDELSQRGRVLLMGDSSGGGLSLGVCQRLLAAGRELPLKTILMSPWVDISLTNPDISEYEKLDPLIWANNGRLTARAWAADISLTDERVSPIFGRLEGLRDISLFVGKREMLYPDVKLLHERLCECGVEHEFYARDGMNHVYQIYPIPEAKKELLHITGIIEKASLQGETWTPLRDAQTAHRCDN